MRLCVGVWLATFGVWPLFEPKHSLIDGPLGAIDLGLHVYGAVLIVRALRDD